MTENEDKKIAMALLEEVKAEVQLRFGDSIVTNWFTDTPFRHIRDQWGVHKDLIKRCELAEKKSPNSQDVLILSNLLKARIYGNWADSDLSGTKGMHRKAESAYKKALELGGDEAQIRYKLAKFYQGSLPLSGKEYQEAIITNFQRVVELVGLDDPLGLECAKEIEKQKNMPTKGCFIATAAYSCESASDVLILKIYRDKFLLSSKLGVGIVKFYYLVSPSLARIISKSQSLRFIVRKLIVHPLANLMLNKISSKV